MAGVVAYLDQIIQVGAETTPGTPVAANRRLQTLMIAPQDNVETQAVKPQGTRFAARTDVNKAYTPINVTGPMDYIEFLVALEMWAGTVTPTTPVGATNARQRVYDVPLTGAITPKTRTIQYGDSTYADQFSGAELVTLGATYTRDAKPAVTGSGFALAKLPGGTTLTASPTTLALQPVMGSHLNFYIDPAGASLGTTQITEEVLSCGWTGADLRTPFWAADRSQLSYKKSLSNSAAKFTLTTTLGWSPVTRTLISDLKGGATRFLRIENQGPLIETGQHFLHQVDCAVRLGEGTPITAWKNQGEVQAIDVALEIVYDTTWAHGLLITSVTDLTAL